MPGRSATRHQPRDQMPRKQLAVRALARVRCSRALRSCRGGCSLGAGRFVSGPAAAAPLRSLAAPLSFLSVAPGRGSPGALGGGARGRRCGLCFRVGSGSLSALFSLLFPARYLIPPSAGVLRACGRAALRREPPPAPQRGESIQGEIVFGCGL